MALDIFSSFDDHNKVIHNAFYILWMITIMIILTPLHSSWAAPSSKSTLLSLILNTSGGLVKQTNMKYFSGSPSLMSSVMMWVIMINLWGLSPYTFSITSHMAANFSLSLTLWASVLMMSLLFNLPEFLMHMQPLGSPWYINPLLCMIELVSLMVRPLTLAVRLTANLSTGHILMALLGLGATNSTYTTSLLLVMMGTFYYLFEMAVCVIQAYIFTLLPTLYSDEHPTK